MMFLLYTISRSSIIILVVFFLKKLISFFNIYFIKNWFSRFFLFIFYEIILVLWFWLWVWRDRLVDPCFFMFFLFLSFNILLIGNHDLFCFAFFEVISVLWANLWVWQVNPNNFFSSFLKLIFLKFYSSILDWLVIILHNLFQFILYEIFSITWFGSWVWWLIQVDFGSFFILFNWFFFSILSFIIELIRNWVS
jgi:hypothetical protein